ncbi:MAG: N(G),N(G)-dimethylarginine dimethylaminohydrolase [Elusimicrobiota bacterium]|nr:N(G),N(G)-dimethylarginine dimethylaminohydrolase [Elusimicrobiota bacterium]
MFKNAIVRTPCKSLINGITSNPQLGKPDYENALRQHKSYICALESCGVKVTVLPPLDDYPDSCFVEDVAVLSEKCAIITNPGAPARNGEIESIIPIINTFYNAQQIHSIKSPGTLEGGDIMRIENTFYAGLSARTNEEGIRQFSDILSKYGYTVITVPLTEVLHLKTGVNYLANNHLLACGEFINKKEFDSFDKTVISSDESYAANCVYMNGKVLVPAGFEKTEALVRGLGFPVIIVDTSEFRKIDGGLSCLSLRF